MFGSSCGTGEVEEWVNSGFCVVEVQEWGSLGLSVEGEIYELKSERGASFLW